MEFGVCTNLDRAAAALAAGWDFVEENVQGLLKGELPDDQWQGGEKAKFAALPVPAANMLVPAAMKICGPDADRDRLGAYMERVTKRATSVGMKILVFGSGGARNVPAGFNRDRARQQIIDFCRMAAELASKVRVTIVAEPLNRGECNIINSVSEALALVKDVDHSNFRCLVDSYHLWIEGEPVENVNAAMPYVAHVHVADKDGRVAPGESKRSDYRPLFRILKKGGYRGRISVEATDFDIAESGVRVLKFLNDQWNES